LVDGDLTYQSSGVYILRDAHTGQLFKPGETLGVSTRVARGTATKPGYQAWVDDGHIPLMMDFYPIPGVGKQMVGHIETALGLFLKQQGWNLPMHHENANATPPVLTQLRRISKAGT
jgi:hypothetical protein